MSKNKIETAVLEWLYEQEGFSQRIERAPKDILLWAYEAAKIGYKLSEEGRENLLRALDNNLAAIQDISEWPTFNSLEVGFRHSPLTIREENDRMKEAIGEITQIVKFMRRVILQDE